MSRFIDDTTPGALIPISTYDRTTRLINPGLNKATHIGPSHDYYAKHPDTGMLVGDFAAMRETHYVSRDADASPFVIVAELAGQFLELMTPEALAAGLYMENADG